MTLEYSNEVEIDCNDLSPVRHVTECISQNVCFDQIGKNLPLNNYSNNIQSDGLSEHPIEMQLREQ